MRTSVALVVLALAAPAAIPCGAAPAFAGGDTESYFVAFLRPDPGRKPIELAERERIMAAHMANIHRMADSGVLIAAGPMEDKTVTISGIFILKAGSLAEARRIAAQDPTITEKRNTIDVHPWLGPKGIGVAYFQWKRDHPAAEDAMAAHAFCLLKHGPSWKGDPRSDGEHAVFIDSLRRAGLLAAAGNIDDDPELFAICIFKTSSADEATRIIGQDPPVQSGRLAVELHRWWTADLVLPW
jgi:uncharacterized protein YciI